MSALEIVRSMIEYHTAMTRRVWDSIGRITEEQFLADDAYSRGSIRNLMIHLASIDRRWLAGLKNLLDVGQVKFEEVPSRESAQAQFEQVAKDVTDYVATLSESELEQNLIMSLLHAGRC
ncbi:MAG TPA: DinB family protein [Anaerolineales bacterium]